MADQAPTISRRERLTATAAKAAGEGHWELVDTCYREREHELDNDALRPDEAERLLEMDRQVQEQAMIARQVLTSLLREASLIRRRLKGLRQGQGIASSESGTLLLEA